MRCFHLQFFFALVPSGEFRASGREFLCPRRQRNQNAAEPTVRTPFFVLCGGSFCERKPPNFCALPWQDWQNVILRLAGPPCRSPCRTAQSVRHAYTARSADPPAPCRRPGSLEKNRALGGEPNEEDRRSRELWRRFDCHRPREVVGKMETARS